MEDVSLLLGVASWLGRPGFIRWPAYCGLKLAECQRSGFNGRDESWSAQGVVVDGLIDQAVDWGKHAHTGDAERDVKQNRVRFGCVLRKFGITSKGLGITAHGLRHEAQIEEYSATTGQEPPLRGGGEGQTPKQVEAARSATSGCCRDAGCQLLRGRRHEALEPPGQRACRRSGRRRDLAGGLFDKGRHAVSHVACLLSPEARLHAQLPGLASPPIAQANSGDRPGYRRVHTRSWNGVSATP